jgi:N-acetylglutamate synthase-like GNAT family acetyltransferase
MENITYRKATEGDIWAVLKLIRDNPTTLKQTDLPDITEFFVALKGEGVVGCCAAVILSNELKTKKIVEIRSLATALQGNGIGSRLVALCEQEAKTHGVPEALAITGDEEFFKGRGYGTFRGERLAMLKDLKKKPHE